MSRRWATAVVFVAASGLAACTNGGGVNASVKTTPAETSTTTSFAPTTPVATSPSTTSGDALTSVDWNRVAYPLDCGSTLEGKVGTAVLQVVYAAPAPGHQLAVVLVACNAGAGTPPRTIYVLDRSDSSGVPHLLQTLSADTSRQVTRSLTATGSIIAANGDTYSSSDVPRCCPDGEFSARWTWTGQMYRQTFSTE